MDKTLKEMLTGGQKSASSLRMELFNTIYADQLICILVFLFYDGPSFLHITMSGIQDFKNFMDSL